MMKFFTNQNIGTRINAGFGTILLLTITLAVMAGFGFSRLTGDFDEYANMTSEALLVADLDINITELRLDVRRYMSSNKDADLELVQKAYAQVRKDIEQAHKDIQNPVRAKLIKEVDVHSVAYKKGFEQIVELINKRNSLVNDQLNVLGPEIRKKLTEMNDKLTKEGNFQIANMAGIVQEDVLTARVNVQKFLDTNSEEQIEKARAAFKSAHNSLAQLKPNISGELSYVLAAVEADLPKYEAAFEELTTAIAGRNKLDAEVLRANGKAIGEEIEAIMVSANEDKMKLQAETAASASNAGIQNMVVAAVALLLGAFTAWFIGRGITAPVNAMTLVMKQLADGDKTVIVPSQDNKDEIGSMAKAVEVFKQNAIEMDRMQAEQKAQELAAIEEKKRSMNALADRFQATVGGVVNTVASAATEMTANAQSLSATAEETSRQSQAVAAASEQASSNVQTVASAAEELSASVAEISRQVAKSSQIAQAAVEQAASTNSTVKGLAESAQKIGAVVQLINDIAGQTNLLALNATIEAARAGEAGKGFAVVASEVKNLATQTAKATEEIGAQISAIQGATAESVKAIEGIGGTINELSEISNTIASAVEEQGAATREIARNVQEASAGTNEVSANIAGVTQAASETGNSAGQVSNASGELSVQAETLRREVDNFLAEVRAA